MKFDPQPVQSVTADQNIVCDALARIPASEWPASRQRSVPIPTPRQAPTIRVDVSAATREPSGWPPSSLGTVLSDGKAVAN
jgi:hypothetical protein